MPTSVLVLGIAVTCHEDTQDPAPRLQYQNGGQKRACMLVFSHKSLLPMSAAGVQSCAKRSGSRRTPQAKEIRMSVVAYSRSSMQSSSHHLCLKPAAKPACSDVPSPDSRATA